MAEATTKIQNKTGIHARPASVFTKEAGKFKSKITIEGNGKKGDAKSILGIMAMGLTKDTDVKLIAEGPDAEEAVAKLKELIDDKFGEE